MHLRGPIAQPGSELPAHNRLVPGSNPGGPISFVPAQLSAGGLMIPKQTMKRETLRVAHNFSGETNCVKR
jgi:hypothetical protein